MPLPLLITVDTELTQLPGDTGLFGTVDGVDRGIEFMIDLFDVCGTKATWFTDVYGDTDDRQSAQKKACEFILAAGHDLQLHTHPGPSFDSRRTQLNQYSRSEQEEILAFGRERIQAWTGHETNLHRAGDWAADENTLIALSRLGFAADFSPCAWADCCRLPEPMMSRNGWTFSETGLMVCTSTCFRDRLTGRNRRLDLEGCSQREVFDIIGKRPPAIVLVLHSFNFFLAFKKSHKTGQQLVRRFEAFVRRCRGYGYIPLTCRGFCDQIVVDGELACETLPVSSLGASLAGVFKSGLRRCMK